MAGSAAKAPRPWTVTVVIVLAVLVFLEQLFVGILALADADELNAEFDWSTADALTSTQVIAAGVAAIILAILGLVATIAYSRGSRSGTIALAILATIAVAAGLIAMRGYADFRPALGALRFVGGVVVLYLLFQQRDETSTQR
jgi:hypothetical protein